MDQGRRREPDKRSLTAWPRSLIIHPVTPGFAPWDLPESLWRRFPPLAGNHLTASQKRATGLLGPSRGINMHPLFFILGFIAFILAVFGLMELHARSIIKRFEQTIKHSQE